jgi:hypothetical protein
MALTLALSGCGGNVVVDGSAASQASNALVVKVPVPGGICAVGAAQDPPGAVFLLVASQPITCAQPELLLDLECPAGPQPSAVWEACIPLQPPLAPTTIDILAFAPPVTLAVATAGCANRSEGIVQDGALAITTVDPSSMTLTLSGTTQQLLKNGAIGDGTYEVSADGTYEALRCP